MLKLPFSWSNCLGLTWVLVLAQAYSVHLSLSLRCSYFSSKIKFHVNRSFCCKSVLDYYYCELFRSVLESLLKRGNRVILACSDSSSGEMEQDRLRWKIQLLKTAHLKTAHLWLDVMKVSHQRLQNCLSMALHLHTLHTTCSKDRRVSI